MVQDYQIEWTRIPLQVVPAITSVTSKENFQLMNAEVENLLLKQAVVVVPPCQDQFISRLFSSREKGWVLPAGSQLETIEFLNLFERNISRWKVPV